MKINVSSLFSLFQGRIVCVVPLRVTVRARLRVTATVLLVAVGLPTMPAVAASGRHSHTRTARQAEPKRASSPAQTLQQAQPSPAQALTVRAVDENGVVVASARIILTDAATNAVV